ncbi:hypothetical protein QTV44_002609 [Vibrio vulnificus]|nr:hypothetical protein [Vibrio vulnificus]
MKLYSRSLIFLSISMVLVGNPAHAVVCTDPAGNMLQIKEMAESAYRWAESKYQWATEYAQSYAISKWEDAKAEYRTGAEIAHITSATSKTANAAAEERYATSPSACQAVTRAKAFLNSLVDQCENPVYSALFEHRTEKISDCGVGGSGLNCGAMAHRREQIVDMMSTAIKEQDGATLAKVLDGGVLVGLGVEPLQPDDQELHAAALSLLLGVNDMPDLPRSLDGSLLDPSNSTDSRVVAEWARGHIVPSVADAAITKVNALYQPSEGGKASIMAQLEDQVNYYQSEEFIKLLTNTNDKSQLPSNWESMSPEEKHEFNASLPPERQITSSEQVNRMIGELISFNTRLSFMNLESSLSTNSLVALQLKEMLR